MPNISNIANVLLTNILIYDDKSQEVKEQTNYIQFKFLYLDK